MHEVHEHIEHAGHDPHPTGNLSRWIGVTIAVLGVLMALCAAQVGAARTELIATMVEENGATLRYQTVSGKYRMLQAQLQQLHALMPDPKAMKATEAELKRLETAIKNPDTVQQVQATRLESKKILMTVTPTREDVLRFSQLIRHHRGMAEAANEWAESYTDAVQVHSLTASRTEVAQVAAEIGIVIASVGLLLGTLRWFARGAWITAVVLGVLSLAILVQTRWANVDRLHKAEDRIAHTRSHYLEQLKEENKADEDEKILREIEADLEQLNQGP
jgi:hypothetical protein